MKLSIIVPVYKVETFLPECINSILGQEFTDFELILVDDGSPDHSGKICDEYAIKDRRIWVIHKANGGLSSARNAGLDIAMGEYVAFVDADDFLAPDFYSKAMKAIAHNPNIDLVEMPVLVHYNHKSGYLYAPSTEENIHGEETIFATWIHHKGYLHAYSWNKICKRSLFERLRFPEGELFEDTYTTPRLLKQCKHVHYLHCEFNVSHLPYPAKASEHTGVYYYRYRENSITTSAAHRAFRDALKHHLPIFREVCQTPSIPPNDKALYYLHLTNMFIDMLRCEEAFDPYNLSFLHEVYNTLKEVNLSLYTLATLPVPSLQKLKNLPLALLGVQIHCFCYTFKWIKPFKG